MSLHEKLEELSQEFEILITPPFKVLELVEAVTTLGEIVREVEPAGTKEQYLELLRESWEWADGKYELIEKADASVKFPIWLAPAEAFDGPAIRWFVEHVLLPELAEKLAAEIG